MDVDRRVRPLLSAWEAAAKAALVGPVVQVVVPWWQRAGGGICFEFIELGVPWGFGERIEVNVTHT